ncbi:MAG: EamA family transporter [Fimbriimonadales bacterium]|nr:EamA family transporter [Fimbriimonadales bacterium]
MRERVIAAAAFFSVYFFWGSTYLATERAVRALPPMLLLGFRFLLAGALLYVGCRFARLPAPTARQWWSGFLQGALLVFGGNAGVTWAVQHLPTGTAALLIATEPLWLVLFLWWFGHSPRPTPRVGFGLLLGVAGILALSGDLAQGPDGWLGTTAAAMVLLTAMSWSLGSAVGVRLETARSPFMASAVAMVAGGMLCMAAAVALGEPATLRPEAVTLESVLALLYLALFASIAGLTAYLWLLMRYSASLVATYAFVNPLVALALGAALNAEPVTWITLVASVMIVASVVLLHRPERRPASETVGGPETSTTEPVFARAS